MNIREISETIEEGETLKSIALAYTEISSLKLKKIREEVIKRRSFFTEILNIYSTLKKTAAAKRKLQDKNPKTANILLTSNNKFYGGIDKSLINFFVSKKQNGDLFVIGRGGKQPLEEVNITSYESIIFKNDLPDSQELTSLINLIRNYQRVFVFFPRFQTIIAQTPVVVDITQQQSSAISDQLSDKNKKTESSFLFEPEADKILDFFDNQLKQVLIAQTFLESELARTASRLIFMDQAQDNADEFVTEQQKRLIQVKKAIENNKLLETIAALRSNYEYH